MSSQDFRQITVRGDALKAERLFRAAVTAFCALTRPSRREIAQLEDLALPLFGDVSVEAKRYVAAALSECSTPPTALIQRLCDESVDIAAPLLIRSPALTDIDLITLIGRHGFGHAHAIGRRPGLNPAIARLVGALENKVVPLRPRDADGAVRRIASASAVLPAEAVPKKPAPGEAAEEVRQQLRAMMRSAPMGPAAATPAARSHYSRLRDAALSGHAPFLHTALADALGMEYDAIREMADEQTPEWLIYALRLLDVSDEQAFLVTAAIYPWLFGDLAAIRRFVSRYAAVGQTEAAERIARCRTTVAQPADSTETAADSHQDQDGLRFRQAIATSPRLSSPRPR